MDYKVALNNANLFDIFIIAEEGMEKLSSLGWKYKTKKRNLTFEP